MQEKNNLERITFIAFLELHVILVSCTLLFHSIIGTTLIFLTIHLRSSLWWYVPTPCTLLTISDAILESSLPLYKAQDKLLPSPSSSQLDLSRCVQTMANHFDIPSSVSQLWVCCATPHFEKYLYVIMQIVTLWYKCCHFIDKETFSTR